MAVAYTELTREEWDEARQEAERYVAMLGAVRERTVLDLQWGHNLLRHPEETRQSMRRNQFRRLCACFALAAEWLDTAYDDGVVPVIGVHGPQEAPWPALRPPPLYTLGDIALHCGMAPLDARAMLLRQAGLTETQLAEADDRARIVVGLGPRDRPHWVTKLIENSK